MQPKLNAKMRELSSKGALKRMRRDGWVPANIYGAEFDNSAISVNRIEFEAMWRQIHGEKKVIEMDVDGEKHNVIIKHIQHHPITRLPLHIDFYRLLAGREIEVNLPVTLVGDAVGAKRGGVVEHILHEVRIACLPKHLPGHIEVDVTGLDLHQSLHVKDLQMENVRLLDDPGQTVVAVLVPRLKTAETEETEEITEPEVIGKEEE